MSARSVAAVHHRTVPTARGEGPACAGRARRKKRKEPQSTSRSSQGRAGPLQPPLGRDSVGVFPCIPFTSPDAHRQPGAHTDATACSSIRAGPPQFRAEEDGCRNAHRPSEFSSGRVAWPEKFGFPPGQSAEEGVGLFRSIRCDGAVPNGVGTAEFSKGDGMH